MTPSIGPCPYIDRDDTRCRSRLTLVNLAQAFSVCVAAHLGCPVHTQIAGEDSAAAVAPTLEPIALTVSGYVRQLARSA